MSIQISLKLIINDRGDVVSTSLNYSDPVSADKVIIENVMREVKKQVKYEIDPGANLVNVYYNVIVKPWWLNYPKACFICISAKSMTGFFDSIFENNIESSVHAITRVTFG